MIINTITEISMILLREVNDDCIACAISCKETPHNRGIKHAPIATGRCRFLKKRLRIIMIAKEMATIVETGIFINIY
jgi:hypothetical protein